jgi:hypothetical protein
VGVVNIALWAAGVILMALGAIRARGPYARYRALQQTDENLRRYEQWRGGHHEEDARQVTGADVMREELRRQLRVWLSLVLVGFFLVLLAFLVNA